MTATTVLVILPKINNLLHTIKSFKGILMLQMELRDRYMGQLEEIHIHSLEDYATVADDDIESSYEQLAVSMTALGERIAQCQWLIKDSEDELGSVLETHRRLWII